MLSATYHKSGLLWLTTLMTIHLCVAQSRFHFEHFDVKSGLADNNVGQMAQDSLGYMWFQYYGGLTRFDGHTFKVYKHDPDDSLRSALNFVLAGLNLDQNKNVWVMVSNHPGNPRFSLVKYDRKKDGFVKHDFDLETRPLRDIVFDRTSPILWVGMADGKGLYSVNMKTKEAINYLNQSENSEINVRRNTINNSKDEGSTLLLATGQGFWSFDKATKTFKRPACNPRDSAFLFQTPFYGILKVVDNNLWVIGGDNNLVKLGPDLSVLQKKKWPNVPVNSLDIGEDNVFWFGTWWDGVYRFDPADDSFINIRNVPEDPHSLPDNSINSVKIDRDQNVWVSTKKGVSKLRKTAMKIVNLDDGFLPAGIYKTKDKEFIIASKLTVEPPFNYHDVIMAEIVPGQVAPLPFKKTPISRIRTIYFNQFVQGKNKLWLSTTSNGMFGYSIDTHSGLIGSGPPVHLYPDPSSPDDVGKNSMGAILEDSEENLWVGRDVLQKINTTIPYGTPGSTIDYKHVEADTNSINGNGIVQIFPEDEKTFWVVTDIGVDLFHRDTQIFEHVFAKREMPNNLCRASDGTLFLGTLNGLYQAIKNNGRYQFDRAPLWNRSEVKAIQEDRLGRLWLHTAAGIVCYDRKEKFALEFNQDDGLLHIGGAGASQFYETSQGVLFTVDAGLTLFDPMSVVIDRTKTNPVLTRLEVNNKNVVVGSKTHDEDVFLIPSDIGVLNELSLDYLHNNFTLEFAAMEMTKPEKNLYRHKLEGYDQDWIETDYNSRSASYTNLPAGTYTFRVKASNHHGIWSDQERTLKVIILPAPWRTWWAYSGYSLAFVGLLILGRRNIVQRERLKGNLRLAKVEQEKEHFELEKAKEVDKMKSTFFANISHEFRTPLTLIKGPVREAMEEFGNHPKLVERMKLVERNADLVLKLINQLLDLAKLESGTLQVEKLINDLNSFVSVIVGSFSSLAYQKDITITTEVPAKRYLVRFDKDKVETILINLINNAIKFTPGGGSINVSASLNNKTLLVLSVSDTGIGIPLDQQDKVFERFHQVSDSHNEVGTGIGLSLVKELVALMSGSISLKSEPGKGSVFTITLPVEQLREVTDLDPLQAAAGTIISDNAHGEPVEDTSTNGLDHRPHVLVVEDNTDLRKFIIESLGDEFHFLEASNGKLGMERAFEFVPDLILSDVMMPEMDGITMTKKLKGDTRTSHIPLILLTAKTSDESKLSGLGTGADDYLTKPFNRNELLLKIRNRIALQTKIREKIKLELLKESPKVEVQSADEKFLLKVKENILSRLSDEQLSVESLAEEIGLSRSQLLRKITGLTGVSVNELIRTFRLQKAAQLIEQNWAPVTQVAYEVGFSNLSYFSKVFKEQYGVLPSDYGKKTVS